MAKDNQILDNSTSKDLTELMGSKGFSLLGNKQKERIINGMFPDSGKDGGLIGKFLGNKPENVMLNIAFLICLFLIGILLFDTYHAYSHDGTINLELIDKIFPIITLSLGYIFGKGSNK